MSDLLETLQQEGVDPALLEAVQQYRAVHALPDALRPRIPSPAFTYYGKQVWEQALAALLCGENLLLAGGKATGKNVLAENLAAAFGRPAWDISFHVNMDAASLIGMDTFADGQVVFRPGPVYRCAQCGGFGVLDEINMAKNEALAVLHAVLDFRRAIDVPGYDRIPLAEETRFIATMNYGYTGTRYTWAADDLHRYPGAERGPHLPFRGHPDAHHYAGRSGKAAADAVPRSRFQVCAPVCTAVP